MNIRNIMQIIGDHLIHEDQNGIVIPYCLNEDNWEQHLQALLFGGNVLVHFHNFLTEEVEKYSQNIEGWVDMDEPPKNYKDVIPLLENSYQKRVLKEIIMHLEE